jgi:murein DD-endopeptidase MepM/ murein hydrolase activator NlpD
VAAEAGRRPVARAVPLLTRLTCATGLVLLAVALSAGHGHAAASPEPLRLTVSHAARAVQPGEVVIVRATSSAPADAVTGEAPSGALHFARTRDPLAWEAVLGVDISAKAGPMRLGVHAAAGSARVDAAYDLLVKPKTFPVRRITVDPKFVDPPASELPRIEREAKRMAAVLGVVSPERLWAGAFTAPVTGPPTSAFGRISVINGQRRTPHTGTDFQAAVGTPIAAPNTGRVVLSEALYFSGETVIIDHGLGVFSFLAHLSRRDVAAGDLVKAGAVVGLSGVTGRITGPHLHWSVRVGPARVDPMSLLAVLGS